MKILAIRGCNLASLAGEFEIDLAHGPLGGTGVFAIVGNTGSGKSTLLDALCVALFDRTPRLTNHSTVKVGRGDDDRALLGAQDVRTLLRRGAAQGWAEVDFESGDARQYRARWSVRRARGQSDGTMQDQQLSLTAIAGGERFGGTKTETLKAIHARLGLSFDQFRRSALLAQGEFAAFLRADGKDRSELLERMTGTQIYSRLSIAAHVRAALAEQRLRDGRAAAQAIAVLDDAAERGIRAELAAAAEAAEAARLRHARAEQVVRWLTEAARRERELAQAGAEHAAAGAALVTAEPDRAELALRRRAEQLRPAWDEVERIERRLAAAVAELGAAGEAADKAARRLEGIAERRARIAAVHAPVRAARIAAGIVERIVRPGQAAASSAAEDAAWLAAHAGLAPEVAAWPELDGRFAQHAALDEAIAALARALTEHAAERARLDRAHRQLAGEVQAATQRHEEAKRKAAGYAQKRGATLDAARRQEDEARTRLGDFERLAAVAAAAGAATEQQAAIDRQLAELAAAAAEDGARRARLGEAQRQAIAVRTEQARVIEELRRAAGYAHARAELVAGEPCPLCGAAEHPWRDRGALDGVIAAAAARLDGTHAELDAIAAELAAASLRDRQRDHDRARLAQLRAAAGASAAAAATAWRDQLGALGELLLVGDPATPAAEALAADRLATARARLEAARVARSHTEAATKAAQDAQAEVQLCQAALDQLAGKLAELERRRAELDATIGRARGEHASKLEQRGALARELTAAMARWFAALPAAPGEPAAAARSAGTVAPARAGHAAPARRGRGAAAIAAGGDHGGAVGAGSGGAAGGDHGGAGSDHGAAVMLPPIVDEVDPTLVLALVARLQASAAPRRAAVPVPSSPLAIVRLALAAVAAAWRERAERVADADAALSAAAAEIDREVREIDRAVAEHTARRGDAELRRDQLGREREAAAARLDTMRGDAGFTHDELRRLLSGDPSRVDALAERLAALDRAAERTRAVVVERERQVAEHAAARPSHGDTEPPAEPAVAPDLDALAAAVTVADRRAAQLAATLAANADARDRRDAALAEIAAAESGVEIDRILGDVIGSHDGKLFRSFAQSLTLDSLLAVANAHLDELAPRYQLERVPRHDLELQVIDRDLGDEIRSVQSLSGGESFLVSLALALGLSSMSAHDVRVRTLLIDEGFGTLDPATLDSALSVLDALQATGRQVGVISHVPALVERVGA
ncbi:MAG TPA: AAA family ATPase, partial [Kofleriaceae bacterium]